MSTPSWGSPTPPPQYAPPTPAPQSKWKIAGIGCGGLFGAFVVLVIIVAIVDPPKKTTPAAQSVAVTSTATSQSAEATPSSVITSAKAKAVPKAKPSPKAKPKPSPQPSCSESRDLIVWYVVPTLPDSAQELGNYNLATCETTLQELQDTSPTGPGYCTEAAWVSDNPGYDADATPAKEPKDVVLSVGPACD